MARDIRQELDPGIQVTEKDVARAEEAAAGLHQDAAASLEQAEINVARMEEATTMAHTQAIRGLEDRKSRQRMADKYEKDMAAIVQRPNTAQLAKEIGFTAMEALGKAAKTVRGAQAQEKMDQAQLAKAQREREMQQMTPEERLKERTDPNSKLNQIDSQLEKDLVKYLGKEGARKLINRNRINNSQNILRESQNELQSQAKKQEAAMGEKLNSLSNTITIEGPDSKTAELHEQRAIAQIDAMLESTDYSEDKKQQIREGFMSSIQGARVDSTLEHYMFRQNGDAVRSTLALPENQAVMSKSTRNKAMNFLKSWDSEEGKVRRLNSALGYMGRTGDTGALRSMARRFGGSKGAALMKYADEWERAVAKNKGRINETGYKKIQDMFDSRKDFEILNLLDISKNALAKVYQEDGVMADKLFAEKERSPEENIEEHGRPLANGDALSLGQSLADAIGTDGYQQIMAQLGVEYQDEQTRKAVLDQAVAAYDNTLPQKQKVKSRVLKAYVLGQIPEATALEAWDVARQIANGTVTLDEGIRDQMPPTVGRALSQDPLIAEAQKEALTIAAWGRAAADVRKNPRYKNVTDPTIISQARTEAWLNNMEIMADQMLHRKRAAVDEGGLVRAPQPVLKGYKGTYLYPPPAILAVEGGEKRFSEFVNSKQATVEYLQDPYVQKELLTPKGARVAAQADEIEFRYNETGRNAGTWDLIGYDQETKERIVIDIKHGPITVDHILRYGMNFLKAGRRK